jgi:hypothetical protein
VAGVGVPESRAQLKRAPQEIAVALPMFGTNRGLAEVERTEYDKPDPSAPSSSVRKRASVSKQ